ncbi:hypothetical protein KC340_g11225 [Hortaea werneckii]|nr:hypothetical protein KC342_g13313 [Hortaea werneckii]KAI7083646.1 hypothetical protein KC339_g13072 [Hortaea werneckii]KAI7224828.1 hypothetical protein KC365_g10391 [Hortaea werneckii]KAI7307827.1 hypothetical protein KC340_g11225 [Hortaea werneckii]KAI7389770.1 hypothetical protein KC328_g8275 [Hortaea werneckii]
MPSYEGSGDKVATRGSFIFDPRLRAHRGIPDHYAPKPALGGFSSPMPSTHGRKRGRSPDDDSNLEAPLASRLSSKRVRTDVSEDGEITEEGTESPGRSFALKDSGYPVAIKEKSPDGTYSDTKQNAILSHRTYVFKAYISARAAAGSTWITDTAATAAQLEVFG